MPRLLWYIGYPKYMHQYYSLMISIKMSILLMIDLKMILPFDYKID